MSSGATAKVLFEYIAEQDDELTLHLGDIITNVEQEEGGWWKGEVNGKSGMFPENFCSIVKSTAALNSTQVTFKAEVRFDYTPEQGDELALVKGIVIDVIDTPDEGWWKGRIDGKEGLFPSNFVHPVETPSSSEPPNKPCPDPNMQKTPESDTKPSQVKAPSKIANLLGMIKPGDLSRSNLKKVGGNGVPDSKSNDQSEELMSHNDAFKPTQMVPPMHVDGEKEKKKLNVKGAVSQGLPKEAKPVQYATALYDYDPELPDELRLTTGDRIKVIETELQFEGWMKGEVNGNVGVFPDNFVELLPLEPVTPSATLPATLPVNHIENPVSPDTSEPSTKEAVKEDPVQSPRQGIAMLPPGGRNLQEELARKLGQKGSDDSQTAPSKIGSKAPPPPVPGSKPVLPGTKPKPQLPHNKPLKPPLQKTNTKPMAPEVPKAPITNQSKPKNDPKPASPKTEPKIPTNILKPTLPKPDRKQQSFENKNEVPVVAKNIVNNTTNRSYSVDELKSTPLQVKGLKEEETDSMLPKCSSASSIDKPSFIDSNIRRSLTLDNSIKDSNVNKYTPPKNRDQDNNKVFDSPVNNHVQQDGDLHLDDVKPTGPLKHIQRAKPPSKSPPSKFYKDKHSLEAIPAEIPVDNSKEVNELKSRVVELETRMVDMDDMFKKLVIQLTDDLSRERMLRSNQQIEVETLKRKLDIFLKDPKS